MSGEPIDLRRKRIIRERAMRPRPGQVARFYERDGEVWIRVEQAHDPTIVVDRIATVEDKQRFNFKAQEG